MKPDDDLPEITDHMLARAIECGFARDRMLPYLAEAAYLRGDYDRVRALLAQMSLSATLPVMKPVLGYWTPAASPEPPILNVNRPT